MTRLFAAWVGTQSLQGENPQTFGCPIHDAALRGMGGNHESQPTTKSQTHKSRVPHSCRSSSRHGWGTNNPNPPQNPKTTNPWVPHSCAVLWRMGGEAKIFPVRVFYAEYHLPMPSRLTRYQGQGAHHFLTFSCYQRRPLLDSDHARITFEEKLEEIRKRHDWRIYGYVLMPEHVHLLVSEPHKHPLATTLCVLKGESSKILKGTHKQFWQIRYYDFNVLTHDKHIEKLRYIHRNPVARGLAEKPEYWPLSSFLHYRTGKPGRVQIASDWTDYANKSR